MTRRDQVRAIVRGELPDRVPTLLECPMDATVDILNSAGPSDHNDLKRFKRRWGDRITIQGGIRSKIADMDEGAMRAHVFDVQHRENRRAVLPEERERRAADERRTGHCGRPGPPGTRRARRTKG